MNIENRFYYIWFFFVFSFWNVGCADNTTELQKVGMLKNQEVSSDNTTKLENIVTRKNQNISPDTQLKWIPSLDTDKESAKNYSANSGINKCSKELNILKRIDNVRYNARKVAFDKLMSGAKLYGEVRTDIQNSARNTVDALFTYKAEKLCADISQDVLNGLSRIGENSSR